MKNVILVIAMLAFIVGCNKVTETPADGATTDTSAVDAGVSVDTAVVAPEVAPVVEEVVPPVEDAAPAEEATVEPAVEEPAEG